jgi:hypothetical protein
MVYNGLQRPDEGPQIVYNSVLLVYNGLQKLGEGPQIVYNSVLVVYNGLQRSDEGPQIVYNNVLVVYNGLQRPREAPQFVYNSVLMVYNGLQKPKEDPQFVYNNNLLVVYNGLQQPMKIHNCLQKFFYNASRVLHKSFVANQGVLYKISIYHPWMISTYLQLEYCEFALKFEAWDKESFMDFWQKTEELKRDI